jgi:hypothetical protein
MNPIISIQLQDVMGHVENFDNLKALEKFLDHEQKFWTDKTSGLRQHSYFNQNGYLENILQEIKTLHSKEIASNEDLFNQKLNSLIRFDISNFESYWLWSGHGLIPAWIESYKLNEDTGDAFFNYFKFKLIPTDLNHDSFKGLILAYEFEMQDESIITKRRISEKASYSILRNRLDETTNKLVKEVDEFQTNFTQWHEETQKSQMEEFSRAQNSRKGEFANNQLERNTEFEQTMSDFKTKITELENTYHEKLRLEKPAQYWHKKAIEYKTNGNKWARILAGILIGGFIFFGLSFLFWLNAKNIGLELNSLQGAILFATIVTIYAIAIQATSKMVFSSYHLQRDAEEREQLAYVYLAITHEQKEIDAESRKIVLQALFSRADTGLLKDSSPTMPGGLAELIKSTKS